MAKQGIILIYTGNGKGKTTASLGQALRAAGQGLKVCFIQFIKGGWPTGEAKMLSGMRDAIELHVMGCGFTWEKDRQEVEKAALEGWNLAKDKIMSGSFEMVVLDELTYPVNYEIISLAEVIEVMKNKPPHVHLVITGRNAEAAMLDAADLVTEMREIKHPYSSGIKAQKGIEF